MSCIIKTAPEILGFLHSLEREPFLAIVHAYFDESGKKLNNPIVTFSGVCVYLSKLHAFDEAWNALLAKYRIKALHMIDASDLNKTCGSLMLAGQTFDERMRLLVPFADCINQYLDLGLFQGWSVRGFDAIDSKSLEKIGNPDEPYYTAFTRAILELPNCFQDDDLISVICDDDRTTAPTCLNHYEAIRELREEVKQKVISLTFADDELFPALQAADMVGYLSRKHYEGKTHYERLFQYLTFEHPTGTMEWKQFLVDDEKAHEISESLKLCQLIET